MKLQLVATKATEVILKSRQSEEAGSKFDLQHSFSIDEASADRFGISFDIRLHNPTYEVCILFLALFKASEPLDEAFRQSHFPIVNAPAIAYPYLRAFISNLTLQAGYEPILLPSINFSTFQNNLEIPASEGSTGT